MILILKQADFSGNNIGHIDIDVQLAQAVVDMMGRYTKYTPSVEDTHAQALNTLYNTLNNNGIWAKIKLLCLPAYANNLGECGKDAKAGVIQDAALSSYYQLSNGKLKYRSDTPSQEGAGYGYPVSGISNDCCVFGIMDTPANQDGGWGVFRWGEVTNYIVPKNQATSTNLGAGPITQVDEGGGGVAPGGSAMIDRFVATGAFLFNYKDNYVTFKDSIGDKIAASTVTAVSMDRFVPLPSKVVGSGYTRTEYGLYIYGCAEGLTDTQMTTLYNALTAFYNAI